MSDTLVLDQTGMPINVIPWRRALALTWVGDKANILVEDPIKEIHSADYVFKIPRVIQLYNKIPYLYKPRIKFSRQNVAVRDNSCCQYCGITLYPKDYTFDHVYPQSLGGGENWNNIVLACVNCNSFKGNLTVPDWVAVGGYSLLKEPHAPHPGDPRFSYKIRGNTVIKPIDLWKPFFK